VLRVHGGAGREVRKRGLAEFGRKPAGRLAGHKRQPGGAAASALAAVFMANTVLAAYIFVSVPEENKAGATTTTTASGVL